MIQARIDEIDLRQLMVEGVRNININNYLIMYRDIKSQTRARQKEILNKFVHKVTIYDNDNDDNKLVVELKLPETELSIPLGTTVHRGSPQDTVHPLTLVFEININYMRRQKRKPRK